MSTKRISDYSEPWENEKDVIQRLLGEWQPSAQELSEKEYEQELYRCLVMNLPDVPVIQQYGIAKGKADIVIQDSHVIEMKLGLSDACELDRTIGQLERYRLKWVDPERGPVYLVIVGNSDPELRDILLQWWTRTCNGMWFRWFYICEIKPGVKGVKRFWTPSIIAL